MSGEEQMKPAPGVKLTYDVYRRVEERFVRIAELSLENGDVLTTPLLVGLEMPLSKIFEN